MLRGQGSELRVREDTDVKKYEPVLAIESFKQL